MSNIFIKDIMGTGVFAVPAGDAALATATTALESLINNDVNLAFARVLAWVETRDGASPPRTLNCLVQQFFYNGEECPDITETDTMTGNIYTNLTDPNITSVGDIQVSIFNAPSGGSSDWSRSSGHIYPTVATDDLYIGGATPNGVWFDDGDMVLGGSAMVGTERLRVVGNIRVESTIDLTSASSAIRISAGAGTVANEKLRVVADATVSTVGISLEFSDPSMMGSTYTNVLSKCGAVAGTSYAHTDFKCDSAGGGVGGTRKGFLFPDMAGTNNQGSTGFSQEGANEVNTFAGRTGMGVLAPTSGTTLRVGTTSLSSGSGVSWVNINTDRPSRPCVGAPNWDHIKMDWTVVNQVGQTTGLVSYIHITSPVSSQNITVSNLIGVYFEDMQSDPQMIYTTKPYAIYQSGAGDRSYFNGQIGLGTAAPATSAALEISSTTRALLVSRMTTTERNALTAVNGMIIYNTTTNAFNFYENGAWVTGSGLA
jgi:hypothetical protein